MGGEEGGVGEEREAHLNLSSNQASGQSGETGELWARVRSPAEEKGPSKGPVMVAGLAGP